MAEYLDATGLKTLWKMIKKRFLTSNGGILTGNLDMGDNDIYLGSDGSHETNTINKYGITLTYKHVTELTSESLTFYGDVIKAVLSSTGLSLSTTNDKINDAYFKEHFSDLFETHPDEAKEDNTTYQCIAAHIISINTTSKTAMVQFDIQRDNTWDNPIYVYLTYKGITKCIGGCYPDVQGVGSFILCVSYDSSNWEDVVKFKLNNA